MNRTEAKNFHNDLNQALAPLLKKYNLTLTKNGVTFGERDVKVSLGFEQLNSDGSHKADESTEKILRLEFRMSGVQNIPATIVGSKVQSRSGKVFVITGYNGRAKKFPIEAQEVSTGQMYKMAADGLKFI